MYVPKKSIVIFIEVLASVQILLIYDHKSLHKFIKKNEWMQNDVLECLDDNGGSYMLFDKQGIPYHVLYINEKSLRVIVHECVHKIHQICFNKGIPISMDNSETIAYLTDFLVQQVYNFFHNNQK